VRVTFTLNSVQVCTCKYKMFTDITFMGHSVVYTVPINLYKPKHTTIEKPCRYDGRQLLSFDLTASSRERVVCVEPSDVVSLVDIACRRTELRAQLSQPPRCTEMLTTSRIAASSSVTSVYHCPSTLPPSPSPPELTSPYGDFRWS